jgi:hypothetical protein
LRSSASTRPCRTSGAGRSRTCATTPFAAYWPSSSSPRRSTGPRLAARAGQLRRPEHSGVKAEVKASGYLQSWAQAKHSRLDFGRVAARTWDENTSDFWRRARGPRGRVRLRGAALQGPCGLRRAGHRAVGVDVVPAAPVRECGYSTVSISWVRQYAEPVTFTAADGGHGRGPRRSSAPHKATPRAHRPGQRDRSTLASGYGVETSRRLAGRSWCGGATATTARTSSGASCPADECAGWRRVRSSDRWRKLYRAAPQSSESSPG